MFVYLERLQLLQMMESLERYVRLATIAMEGLKSKRRARLVNMEMLLVLCRKIHASFV